MNPNFRNFLTYLVLSISGFSALTSNTGYAIEVFVEDRIDLSTNDYQTLAVSSLENAWHESCRWECGYYLHPQSIMNERADLVCQYHGYKHASKHSRPVLKLINSDKEWRSFPIYKPLRKETRVIMEQLIESCVWLPDGGVSPHYVFESLKCVRAIPLELID